VRAKTKGLRAPLPPGKDGGGGGVTSAAGNKKAGTSQCPPARGRVRIGMPFGLSARTSPKNARDGHPLGF